MLSPLTTQIFEFCESELFQETIQDSKVASNHNCCYIEQSSYTKNDSFPQDVTKHSSLVDNIVVAPTTSTTATITPTTNIFSLILEDEITEKAVYSTPLDLTSTSHFTNNQQPFSDQDQFDLSLLQNQVPRTRNDKTIINEPIIKAKTCEEDILSTMSPSMFMKLHHPSSPYYSCIYPSINSYLPISTEGCGVLHRNLFLRNDHIQTHELQFHGDEGGIFYNDALPSSYKSNELQARSNESQHHVSESVSSVTQMATEITSLNLESARVNNKLTGKEKKEKIRRYMKKRNERNFNKKIKYACRKTLADRRPRVKGRFAKNDEFWENIRTNINHEEDTDEDVNSNHISLHQNQLLYPSTN